MGKGEFRIRNTNNLTAEEIIGLDVSVKCENGNIIPIGMVSKADEKYIYIEVGCNNNIEIAGD